MSDEIGKGTAGGALEYLDVIIEKGKGTPGAINPLKIAFEKVVSVVDGSDWRRTEVSSINIEEYIARFGNLTRGKYTDKTLSVYKSRVNRVIGWYTKFMSDETPGFFPMVQTRATSKKSDTNAGLGTRKNAAMHDTSKIQEAVVVSDFMNGIDTHMKSPARPLWDDGLLEFPFPLSDGIIANLRLPKTLNKSDAERMAQFIRALVVESAKTEG